MLLPIPSEATLNIWVCRIVFPASILSFMGSIQRQWIPLLCSGPLLISAIEWPDVTASMEDLSREEAAPASAECLATHNHPYYNRLNPGRGWMNRGIRRAIIRGKHNVRLITNVKIEIA